MEKHVPRVGGSRSKRVLWLIDSLTTGGAERLVPVFARSYDRRKFDLEVVCLKEINGNAMAASLNELNIPLTVVNARNLRDISAFRRLVKIITKGHFDLIHTHLTYSDIWGRIAGLITGTPVVSTVHVASYTTHEVTVNRAGWVERVADMLRRHIGGPVITVSNSLREKFRLKGYSEDRLVTIRNGIVVEDFRLSSAFSREHRRKTLRIPPDAPVVVTVSALREGKGHELLLNAARELVIKRPNIRFLFVGGGPLEDRLVEHAERNGLGGHVIFTGMRTDIAEMLALADVFVLPSENDSLPTAIFEAMALGLPAIGLNSGGVPEIISNGETGIVVSSPDEHSLAGAIDSILSDPVMAEHMGHKARRRAETEFSSVRWAANLELLYEGVLSSR